MRDYGLVQSAFWGHPDVVGLSDQAKLLALYLLTGPHSNGLGCYRLPDGYVSTDLGWPVETVRERFQELVGNGFCNRCETTFFVLIPGFLKWNPIANQNVASAREKEFREIPSRFTLFQELASALLKNGTHFKDGFETLLKRYGKQEQEQEQNRTEPNRTEPLPASVFSNEKTTAGAETESSAPCGECADKSPPAKHANGHAYQDTAEGHGEMLEASAKHPPSKAIPVKAIVDLYHQLLPNCPRVMKVTAARAAAIQARWRSGDLPDLETWAEYFRFVSESRFLTGQTQPQPGRPRFVADLEWLAREGNYAKVYERKFHRGA